MSNEHDAKDNNEHEMHEVFNSVVAIVRRKVEEGKCPLCIAQTLAAVAVLTANHAGLSPQEFLEGARALCEEAQADATHDGVLH
jgi:thiamine phosphate synthase YjbQ (UPF0047 family)